MLMIFLLKLHGKMLIFFQRTFMIFLTRPRGVANFLPFKNKLIPPLLPKEISLNI